MGNRSLAIKLLVALLITFGAVTASADEVKDLILSQIDPDGTRGMVVKYYAELNSTQQAAFDSACDSGSGYFISPVDTITTTTGGVTTRSVAQMYIVELTGGIASPVSASCNHSGCQGSGCVVEGCHPTTGGDGKPACTGASCGGQGCAGNPSCSKIESTGASAFDRFVP